MPWTLLGRSCEVVLPRTQQFNQKTFDFDGTALNWFDLPKLSFRYVKPTLAAVLAVFARAK